MPRGLRLEQHDGRLCLTEEMRRGWGVGGRETIIISLTTAAHKKELVESRNGLGALRVTDYWVRTREHGNGEGIEGQNSILGSRRRFEAN